MYDVYTRRAERAHGKAGKYRELCELRGVATGQNRADFICGSPPNKAAFSLIMTHKRSYLPEEIRNPDPAAAGVASTLPPSALLAPSLHRKISATQQTVVVAAVPSLSLRVHKVYDYCGAAVLPLLLCRALLLWTMKKAWRRRRETDQRNLATGCRVKTRFTFQNQETSHDNINPLNLVC